MRIGSILIRSNQVVAKTTQFKHMLHSDRLEFILEAHNGLSAKIVEEAGFKGIWASGLSISAALGVRDRGAYGVRGLWGQSFISD